MFCTSSPKCLIARTRLSRPRPRPSQHPCPASAKWEVARTNVREAELRIDGQVSYSWNSPEISNFRGARKRKKDVSESRGQTLRSGLPIHSLGCHGLQFGSDRNRNSPNGQYPHLSRTRNFLLAKKSSPAVVHLIPTVETCITRFRKAASSLAGRGSVCFERQQRNPGKNSKVLGEQTFRPCLFTSPASL